MQRLLVLALPAVVTATKCAAGRKHKTDLTSAFCSTSATDAASCDSGCCEADTKTCGGITGLVCPFGTYAANDDAWKKKKTTAKTKTTDCCQPTVTCDNTLYSCPAGYKKSSTQHKTKCPAGPKSCAITGTCCVADALTCGGYQISQKAAGKAVGACATPASFETVDQTKADKSWMATKLSAGTKFATECCVAKPTCASVTCKAGYAMTATKKAKVIDGTTIKISKAGTSNEGDMSNEAVSVAIKNTEACCAKIPSTGTNDGVKADTTKTTCGTITVSCPAGEYYPKTAYSHILATSATMANKCCAPTATCAAAVCPAGYKMKANVATSSCHGDHFACNSICCEVDKTTCGGLSASVGLSCSYGTYDESATWVLSGDGKTSQATMDAWKKLPATAATKNTACCTAAAACKYEPVGTTTPAAAAAVTTTPAVPI